MKRTKGLIPVVSILISSMLMMSSTALASSETSLPLNAQIMLSSKEDRVTTVQEQVYIEEPTKIQEMNGRKNEKRYIVGLKKNVESENFKTRKGLQKKKTKKLSSSNSLGLNLDVSEVQSLQSDTNIAYIEPDSEVNIAYIEPDSEVNIASIGPVTRERSFSITRQKNEEQLPWGIHAVGADLLTEKNQRGNAIRIAILDTGISDHPDLQVKGGVSFVEGFTGYQDDNGHGTHVAGTIAALDNRIGVIGVAPQSEIFAVKVLNQSGTGTYSQVIQGIEWAIQNRMNIISISFGGSDKSRALHEAIQAATEQGILVVAAAGNSGKGAETEAYPALYPETISVGAVTKQHLRADYSSTGNEIDLVAPGSEILSTTSDQDYGNLSGTSMAAPHVTGSLAALWSAHKNWTGEQVKNKLFETATKLGGNLEYGHGLVNLARALGVIDKPIPPAVAGPIETSSQDPLVQWDRELLQINNRLLGLKKLALKENNIEAAKKIEDRYNELLIENLILHDGMELVVTSDDGTTVGQSVYSSVYAVFESRKDQFDSLRLKYQESVNEFQILLPNYVDEDPAVSILDNRLYLNLYKDVSLGAGDSYYYSFVPEDTGMYKIYTGPFGGYGSPNDTELKLFTDWQLTNQIASNNDANGSVFSEMNVMLTKDTEYYVQILPHSGAVNARLSVSSLWNMLNLLAPVDVDSPVNTSQVFCFTPSAYGNYSILTDYFGGVSSSGSNDTMLYMYSDANLTNLIAFNDDHSGSTFSEIRVNMIPGQNYYIKVVGHNGSYVHTRLSVKKNVMTWGYSNTITPGSNVNVREPQLIPEFFQFTPSVSGQHNIDINPFNYVDYANPTILIFSQPDLTGLLEEEHNYRIFPHLSAGVTYYIVFQEDIYIEGRGIYANISIPLKYPDTAPPTAPSGLKISGSTANSVTLSWTASTDNVGVAGYDIYQGAMLVGSVNGATTTFTVAGLTANTTYSFSVKSKDGSGNLSAASGAINAIIDTLAPTVPSNVVTSGKTNSTITLTWTASTDNVGIAGYDIYQGAMFVGSVNGATTTFTVAGLTANTTYSFSVKSKDGSGNLSAASGTINAIIDTLAPTDPSNVVISGKTNNTTTLIWTASTDNVGVTGYDIYNGSTLAGSVNGSTTMYTVTGLSANTLYILTVKAKDGAGNLSLSSNAISVFLNGKLTYTYDSRGRLTSISITSTGQIIKTFVYDNNGNLISK
ncbi:S8 family serine peptidase [Paenibacillus sp. HWE-109]|uniref:S8 family serine peptidase n=1 Tax=Paenibacillus sp. HWE-109 TaxID=1306526 RepID=UPI001EDE25FF|nr:S8 family serine peptidase [Paenibacillus sp. HWE-109]UKS24777.1 S8 family serine peptidase [Paenibacillus sp. HWE-109]